MLFPETTTILSEILAASIGGAISTTLLYPLDVFKIIRLVQSQSQQYTKHSTNTNQQIFESNHNCNIESIQSHIVRLCKEWIQSYNNSNNSTNSSNHTNSSNQCCMKSDDVYDWWTIALSGIEITILQSMIEKGCYYLSYTILSKYIHQYIFHPSSMMQSQFPTISINTTTNHATSNSYSNNNHRREERRSIMHFMLNLVYGYISEWIHLPITIPLDTIKTQMMIQQCHNNTRRSTSNDQRSPLSCTKLQLLLSIIQQKSSLYDYYTGLSNYFILCWKSAIQYTIYEQCKSYILQRKQQQQHYGVSSSKSSHIDSKSLQSKLSYMEILVIGMISRMISTMFVYPSVRNKMLKVQQQQSNHTTTTTTISDAQNVVSHPTTTEIDVDHNHCHIQKNSTSANSNKHIAITLIGQLYQSILKSYDGILPELVRGILSVTITMLMKEYMTTKIKTMLSKGLENTSTKRVSKKNDFNV